VSAQSRKAKKVKREILGDQLDYGRKAAEFGLWNEAIFHWEKVVEADPQNSNATNNLAVAYESVGAYDKAEALYRSALDLNEDNAEIRKNMKRFRSFYRKHKRQLAREEQIKAKRKQRKEKNVPDKPSEEEQREEGGSL
jgi:Flp pilus assembly protein TadD